MEHPRSHPEPGLPLPVLDDLLGGVAHLLHDRAVQSLVAAGLLLETAVPAEIRDDLADRGLAAITAAGQQARDVMWALTTPAIRRGRLAGDLADHVARLPSPDGGAAVAVDVPDEVPQPSLDVLLAALHAVLADVLLDGGRLLRVRLGGGLVLQAVVAAEAGQAAAGQAGATGPAGAASAAVGAGGDPAAEGGPWLALARARLAPLGGRLERSRRGGVVVTDLAVPLLGDADPGS